MTDVRKRIGDLRVAIRSEKPTLTRYREIRTDRQVLSVLIYDIAEYDAEQNI